MKKRKTKRQAEAKQAVVVLWTYVYLINCIAIWFPDLIGGHYLTQTLTMKLTI